MNTSEPVAKKAHMDTDLDEIMDKVKDYKNNVKAMKKLQHKTDTILNTIASRLVNYIDKNDLDIIVNYLKKYINPGESKIAFYNVIDLYHGGNYDDPISNDLFLITDNKKYHNISSNNDAQFDLRKYVIKWLTNNPVINVNNPSRELAFSALISIYNRPIKSKHWEYLVNHLNSIGWDTKYDTQEGEWVIKRPESVDKLKMKLNQLNAEINKLQNTIKLEEK